MRKNLNKVTGAGLLIALGIIYGDIGTSPLYVFNAIIHNRVISDTLMIGSLSCIIWTITLQTTIKYVIMYCVQITGEKVELLLCMPTDNAPVRSGSRRRPSRTRKRDAICLWPAERRRGPESLGRSASGQPARSGDGTGHPSRRTRRSERPAVRPRPRRSSPARDVSAAAARGTTRPHHPQRLSPTTYDGRPPGPSHRYSLAFTSRDQSLGQGGSGSRQVR